jgi:hypothetical protein
MDRDKVASVLGNHDRVESSIKNPLRAPANCAEGAARASCLAVLCVLGCVPKDVPMAEIGDPARPNSVVLYSGVRDTVRRFADYGQIEAEILK